MNKFANINLTDFDFSTCIYQNEAEEPQHFHRSYEILIVLKGAINCTIDNFDYHCKEGCGIFICPLQMHCFSVPEGTVLRRITFHEHLILTVHQSIKNSVPRHPVFEISEQTLFFTHQLLKRLFKAQDIVLLRITPYSKRIEIKGMLYLLCGEFLETAQLVSISKQVNIGMEIVQYIADHYKDNISLHDIADQKGYNYHYLSRKFNQFTNMSFKKMLNLYRAQQAYLLLQDTDLDISFIAYECGFQSIRSFNQVCQDIYRNPPTELRASRNI